MKDNSSISFLLPPFQMHTSISLWNLRSLFGNLNEKTLFFPNKEYFRLLFSVYIRDVPSCPHLFIPAGFPPPHPLIASVFPSKKRTAADSSLHEEGIHEDHIREYATVFVSLESECRYEGTSHRCFPGKFLLQHRLSVQKCSVIIAIDCEL